MNREASTEKKVMEERVPVPGFGFLKPESRDYIETKFQVFEQIRLNGLMS